ncbi:hypothetical protein LSAT2_016967 [Lamellibrachia satsuma]|nr:hypothetical protein LSAT2_016967 [Lamellibrachia satsuma]
MFVATRQGWRQLHRRSNAFPSCFNDVAPISGDADSLRLSRFSVRANQVNVTPKKHLLRRRRVFPRSGRRRCLVSPPVERYTASSCSRRAAHR